MASLRRRLITGTALGTAAVLLAAGFALYAMVKSSLLSEFDHALLEKARTLAGMIEQEERRVELEFAEADMSEFTRTDRPEYFQVWLADGGVIARSDSLSGRDLPLHQRAAQEPIVQAITLPDGRTGRIVSLGFTARPDDELESQPRGKRLILSLARDDLALRAALASLRFALILVGLLATLASAGLLAWLVPVGLRPVEALARDIGGIDERKLSERIDHGGAPAELRPIVQRLNELLGRLHAAFEREKIMTADVAHELRTPLAGLRSTLEVALSRERDQSAYRTALSECLSICQQTQTMVDTLLALARLDAGGETIRHQQTNLENLAHDAWAPFDAPAHRKRLAVRWQIEPGLTATTDADKLRLVLGNLFENAVTYADAGGDAVIQGLFVNAGLRICVSNSGSKLGPDDAEHVFDRFWRGDGAREKAGLHCGLGLPLCKMLVERLGGTISADSRNGSFSVTINLPSSPRSM